MRVVVQRVKRGQVTVAGEIVGKIEQGLVVLLGIGKNDSDEDANYLADKIANLRIFPDHEGKLNLSIIDKGFHLLAISQFTLFGDCRRGRRPSFTDAMKPEEANQLYIKFVEHLRKLGIEVSTGQFQADMDVELVNQGPVTMLLDSKKMF
ncbi:MAG: D-aminoacyl-tRNA deacylase [Bacillota bacterium]|nr:D-aminoacyl-tRNA deacylase [Bacillota bacterium]